MLENISRNKWSAAKLSALRNKVWYYIVRVRQRFTFCQTHKDTGRPYGSGFAQPAGPEYVYKPRPVFVPEDKRQLHRFFQEAGKNT